MSAASSPVRRLKMLAEVRVSNVDKKSAEGEEQVQLCNYTDVYYRDRIDNSIDFMPATASARQVRSFSLRMGDVLITKDSESWDDIAVSAVIAEPVGAVCGYHLALLRPNPERVDGRFLDYSIKAGPASTHFKVEANGVTRYAIGLKAIGDAPIPAPPLAKQTAVADYLDSEIARIDALIDRKQRFIDLLLEKRTALITHAVTKGLDSNVEMRDSGIPWFGRVPSHWQVARLKDLTMSIQTGPFGTQVGTDDYIEGGVPLINPAHIIDEECMPSDTVTVSGELAERLRQYQMSAGDVVCARRGDLGRCAVVRECQEGWLTGTGSLRVRPDRARIESAFLQLLISQPGSRDWLKLQSVGSTMDNLNETILSRLPVAAPSVDEQRRILTFMTQETKRLDALVLKTRQSIDLLREYRTALISAAVTGQIDIPGTDETEDVA